MCGCVANYGILNLSCVGWQQKQRHPIVFQDLVKANIHSAAFFCLGMRDVMIYMCM